jgi:hypothetical protein
MKTKNIFIRPTLEQTNEMLRTMLKIIRDLKERTDPTVRDDACRWERHFRDAKVENGAGQSLMYASAHWFLKVMVEYNGVSSCGGLTSAEIEHFRGQIRDALQTV